MKKISRPKGRPRSFDTEKALDRALRVFWREGYEGASLSDLTDAMGINRPSLYAAFGDKETLFRKALDRYSEGPGAYVCRALEAPTGRAVAERLLAGAVEMLSNPHNPRGCLTVQGALACGAGAEPVRMELASRRASVEAKLTKRLKRAQTEGDLRPDVSPADLAHYLATVMNGMAIQAAGGASRRELHRVAEWALRAWPE